MKAISLWQPWASAIAVGIKKIETRSWQSSYRGPIAIHATKKLTPEMREWWRVHVELLTEETMFQAAGIADCDDLPLGAIVATAVLVDIRPTEWLREQAIVNKSGRGSMEYWWGDYSPGRFGWMLSDVRRLTDPVPATGKQGLWEWRGKA